MGRLVSEAEDRSVELRVYHLIGRSYSCHLRLARSEVSGLHAALRWSERGWELRDLGSSNGTLLNGALIAPGPWVEVTAGSEIAFGHPEARWVLRSDAGPLARAIPADGGPAQEERGGMLSLPDAEDPQALVLRGEDGRWVVEHGDGTHAPPDGDELVVAGRRWTLELPEADPRTPLLQPAALARPRLSFRVSADEEFVSLRVRLGEAEHDLGARAHHYLLLTLARLRIKDQAADSTNPSAHGWVGVERLTRMLRLDERPLNLQIFRIRRQFAELGLQGSTEIIERRRGTGQLRLGAADVVIGGMGEPG